ncbi:hypothetical protein K1719_001605 [Acacia pycnantha]|nr:hypothetical protein K1719_001605 [Acacia pycnantha]
MQFLKVGEVPLIKSPNRSPLIVAYVEVYSLRSGSWKEVEFGIENVGLFSHQTTVNGAIFWFGFGREPDTSTYYVIVSFDIANEVFSLIPTPDRFDPRSRSSFAVHENKLALLSFSPTQQDRF